MCKLRANTRRWEACKQTRRYKEGVREERLTNTTTAETTLSAVDLAGPKKHRKIMFATTGDPPHFVAIEYEGRSSAD